MRTLIDETDSRSGRHLIRPEHINTGSHFWNAFGNNETEISASWIVRLCQLRGGWPSFTREQIEALYNATGLYNFTFNELVDGRRGFVVLGADGKYRVTHEFICRCFAASPALDLPVVAPPRNESLIDKHMTP